MEMHDSNENDSELTNTPDSSKNLPPIFQYLKQRVRLEIFFLLVLYGELNVTQISNALHRNKATVARHLKQMETLKVLRVKQDNTSNRTIKPLKYHIPPENLVDVFLGTPRDTSSNPVEKRGNYLKQLERIRATSVLVENAYKLISPFIDHLEQIVRKKEFPVVERIFADFITVRKKLSLRVLPFEESKMDEFNELYQEFRQKIETLANRPSHDKVLNGEKPIKGMLFVDVRLPLLSLLEIAKPKGKKNTTHG